MNWRSSLRWFAAEFLVVVTGVLVALALQSWWEQREHARRERIYLRHLSADLQRTREIIQRANVTLGGSDSAGSRLVRAYHTEGFTERDSLYAWFFRAATYQTPTPITATADALVSTGDLRLLSNDTLRSAVSDYLNGTNRIQREQDRFVTMMTEAVQQVSPYLNFSEALAAVMTPEQIAERSRHNIFFPLPAENLRRPRFSSSLDEILNNRTVYAGIQMINVLKLNMLQARQELDSATVALQRRVAAELARAR